MSSDDTGAPFVGPRPFERGDADIFVGREREVSELLSLVVAYRIVLIYAVSGAGKTSLLNAALIPGLEVEEGFEVLPVARVRGLKADAALPSVPKNVYVFNVLSNWSETASQAAEVIAGPVGSRPTTPIYHTTLARGPAARTGKLTEISVAEYLARRPHPVGTDGFAAPRTVIFDQFEELFSLHPEHWRHRAAFLEQIAAALRDDDLLRVVFALREEYLAELDRYHFLLPRDVTARFGLTRLGFAGALNAVTKPVELTRSFAPDVAEKLVSNLLRLRVVSGTGDSIEVEGEFVEPVQLQVVCRSLWDKLPPDVSVIDERHLLRFGDVDDVLGRFYSEAIEAAATRQTSTSASSASGWKSSSSPAMARGGRCTTPAIPPPGCRTRSSTSWRRAT